MIFGPQIKLLFHNERIKLWLKTNRTYPILAEIAPVGYCNAKCPWCFFKDKVSKKVIDKDTMLTTLCSIKLQGTKAINWTGGGEPTLHPNFKTFVKRASLYGLKQGLFTNGYKTIPEQNRFEWIRISLTEKGFKRIKKPKVPFGICVNHVTEHTSNDLEELCKEAKSFGAKYFQIRPALVGSYFKQPYLLPPYYLEKYDTNKFKVFLTEYKYIEARRQKEYKDCYGYHFCYSIDWNAKVGTCLYMMNDKKFILGDLKKQSFHTIWDNIPIGKTVIEKCQNCCKNHEINMLLYKAKYIESEDFL